MLLQLAFQSLFNRKSTSILTVTSIALSIALLMGVDRTRRAAEDGFTESISKTDLIVGARSGPMNLVLYTLFNMGSATNNISIESYEKFRAHPAVAWTIPMSLGDSHRGYRTVGTDQNFFQHYQYRGGAHLSFAKGEAFTQLWDVVVGAEVARALSYQLEQRLLLTHGVTKGQGIQHHDNKHFKIVGILNPTGTAVDRSVYISLESLEAVHLDWQTGAAPTAANEIAQDQIKMEDLKVDQITSFLVGTRSRIEVLRLQREVNEFSNEPLLAIIPGVTLAELWQGLGYFERALRVISWLVLLVGLVSMLIALLTSLNERRREMSILRALGAGPSHIFRLMILESTVLTTVGIGLGFALQLLMFGSLKSWLENSFGLYLVGDLITPAEIASLCVALTLGIAIGIWPAFRASQMALKDGLSR
jgi:putative ABC transport system permease protein